MTQHTSADSTGLAGIVQARRRRRRRNSKLLIAVIAAALAVPTAAGAAPVDFAGPNGSAPQAGQGNGNGGGEQAVVLRRDGSKAEPFTANVGGTTVSTATTIDDGFAWGDAAIGAGATAGLIAIAGGSALALRRRGGYANRSVATGS